MARIKTLRLVTSGGDWTLYDGGGQLYLMARYVAGHPWADGETAFVRLTGDEAAAWRKHGASALDGLAARIHDGSPHEPGSPFYARDLYRDQADQIRGLIATADRR